VGRAGQLRKPGLVGAHQELNAALHRLHLLAGRPSLAEIAQALKGAGISRSTIHDAFCSQRLPKVESDRRVGGGPFLPGARWSPRRGPEGAVRGVVACSQGGRRAAEPRAPDRQRAKAEAHELLQRALLPQEIPQIDGLEIASRYLPASDPRRAGGDWFDVIPLEAPR
jgi:hypothetical protein